MELNINFFNSNWLKEFIKQLFGLIRQLSNPTKMTVTIVLVLIAFWFLSIFIIGRHFFDNNSIWIVLLISFVTSTAWLAVNILLISIFAAILSPIIDELGYEIENKNEALIVSAGLNSIIYLSVVLLFSYYKHLAFFDFVLLCSSYVVFALVVLGVISIVILRSRNRQ